MMVDIGMLDCWHLPAGRFWHFVNFKLGVLSVEQENKELEMRKVLNKIGNSTYSQEYRIEDFWVYKTN